MKIHCFICWKRHDAVYVDMLSASFDYFSINGSGLDVFPWTAIEVVTPVQSQCKKLGTMKTQLQVCITILQTSLDQFRVFTAGSVSLILGSILPFCIDN